MGIQTGLIIAICLGLLGGFFCIRAGVHSFQLSRRQASWPHRRRQVAAGWRFFGLAFFLVVGSVASVIVISNGKITLPRLLPSPTPSPVRTAATVPSETPKLPPTLTSTPVSTDTPAPAPTSTSTTVQTLPWAPLPSQTPLPTDTSWPTWTPSLTPTITLTPTVTYTPTSTPTPTVTSTARPTRTPLPTDTHWPALTPTGIQ